MRKVVLAGALFVYLKVCEINQPHFLHVQRQPLQIGDQCNLAMINFTSGTAAFQMKTTNEEVRWKISQIRWVQGGWAGRVHPSPAWYKPEHLGACSLSHILSHANTQNKCSFIDALKWTWHTMLYFHIQNKERVEKWTKTEESENIWPTGGKPEALKESLAVKVKCTLLQTCDY